MRIFSVAIAAIATLLAVSASVAGTQTGANTTTNASAAAASQQSASDAAPAAGGHEIELWSGGGPSVSGGIRGLGVWNAGLRYGWVLTGLHGPSFLRGRGEYAVDAVPIFWVFQPKGTAYGLVLVPMALKWNFAQRGRFVPYFDLDGGVLFTSRDTPPRISKINFTPSAAMGVHFLRHKYYVSAEFRFLHVSDAGLTDPNPGINTIEVRMGIGLFTHSK